MCCVSGWYICYSPPAILSSWRITSMFFILFGYCKAGLSGKTTPKINWCVFAQFEYLAFMEWDTPSEWLWILLGMEYVQIYVCDATYKLSVVCKGTEYNNLIRITTERATKLLYNKYACFVANKLQQEVFPFCCALWSVFKTFDSFECRDSHYMEHKTCNNIWLIMKMRTKQHHSFDRVLILPKFNNVWQPKNSDVEAKCLMHNNIIIKYMCWHIRERDEHKCITTATNTPYGNILWYL